MIAYDVWTKETLETSIGATWDSPWSSLVWLALAILLHVHSWWDLPSRMAKREHCRWYPQRNSYGRSNVYAKWSTLSNHQTQARLICGRCKPWWVAYLAGRRHVSWLPLSSRPYIIYIVDIASTNCQWKKPWWMSVQFCLWSDHSNHLNNQHDRW